eukprot:UN33272
MDFAAEETRLFSMSGNLKGNILKSLYFEKSPANLQAKIDRIGKQLAGLFLLLKVKPQICYRKGGPKELCLKLKNAVEGTFKDIAKNTSFEINANTSRPILLILDRSTDMLAPIMHEVTYQAMVHDLMEIQADGIIETGTEG